MSSTIISLSRGNSRELPEAFREDDVRYAESLVEYFLERLTTRGEYVLDPFAGYGTTLEVAERMERVPFGVELDSDRVAYARTLLATPSRLVHGDSRQLLEIDLPRFHLSLTSPPYMCRSNHPEDPLSAYQEQGAGYREYLCGLGSIYRQVREFLLPGAWVVVEVSNLRSNDEVTPLAWDVAAELSAIFGFRGEVIIKWDTPAYGYDHSYCLLFEHSR